MDFKKIIQFQPAYDKRSDDPSKNYGVGGMMIRFVLSGPKGAIQFLLSTAMHIKKVHEEWKFKNYHPEWIGYDVGYHSPKPMFEGQEPIAHDCEYVEGGTCYYDGSSLQAESVGDKFIEKGEQWLWYYLENCYNETFELDNKQETGDN